MSLFGWEGSANDDDKAKKAFSFEDYSMNYILRTSDQFFVGHLPNVGPFLLRWDLLLKEMSVVTYNKLLKTTFVYVERQKRKSGKCREIIQ